MSVLCSLDEGGLNPSFSLLRTLQFCLCIVRSYDENGMFMGH